jgi:hypothetical protein
MTTHPRFKILAIALLSLAPLRQARALEVSADVDAFLSAANFAAMRTALGLDSLYQPLDGDLTALAALSGTGSIYYRSAANTWSAITIGSGLSFNSGTLASSIDLTAPGAIGGTTPGSGAFTTLSASSSLTLTDATLVRDASNTLALRNSTTAQKLIVYATYTDGSNNRRVAIDANGANAAIQLLSSGSGGNSPFYIWNGTSNILSFGTAGAERFQISSSGHFLAGADATYDIGASGASRPRDLFLSRGATLGGALTTTTTNGGAVTTGGTISTSNTSCVRVSPAAAVTGVILGAGSVDGQRVTISNEATAANTITFAAAGTSNVADGTSSVIAGLTARSFVWVANSSRWFPEK